MRSLVLNHCQNQRLSNLPLPDSRVAIDSLTGTFYFATEGGVIALDSEGNVSFAGFAAM